MERTQWKLLHRTFTMDATSLNLQYGSYLMELTPRKLPHGTYTIQGTSWNLHH